MTTDDADGFDSLRGQRVRVAVGAYSLKGGVVGFYALKGQKAEVLEV
jgi:hypothetical protein